MKIKFYHIISKEFRSDIKLWESKIIFLWFIPYYKYEIFKDGKMHTSISLITKSRKTKKYFKFVGLPSIRIGRKEFEEQYKGNKWLVPLNFVLDLNMP